jgi:hypothetical protein
MIMNPLTGFIIVIRSFIRINMNPVTCFVTVIRG